ncbi:MAG: PHP domain-containing protein [Clostridia bacterium]|nr:PHP domain-containing protein [Clostridia bacterium]
MKKLYYDLHMHSCLSPCADNDMTPANIAGMGAVAKLDIMALTDHNTCKNCPAFFKAAEKYNIVPVAGMELTTAEDIHLICLFPELENALGFSEEINSRRVLIKNNTGIFGDQLIMNENDEVTGSDEYILPNATSVSVDEAPGLAGKYSGICYPAHIDRQSNGIIAVLGVFPDEPEFPCFEIHDEEKTDEYKERFPVLRSMPAVVSSDAHYLWDINGREHSFEFKADRNDAPAVRRELIERLSGR